MDYTQKRTKAVNWCSQENDLIIKLLVDNYDQYYATCFGSKKGMKAVRSLLHEKWAEQLTNLRFARRTPAQVAEKIKKSNIITKKFINSSGESMRNGRIDDLPPHLRPLEKKLREEYSKQPKDSGLEMSFDDSALRVYNILRNVKEESIIPQGGVNGNKEGGAEFELDFVPNGNENNEESSLNSLSHVSAMNHILDPPLVTPVPPFKDFTCLPSLLNKNNRHVFEEDLEDISAKRHRLVDAEMELIRRKRYLVEMKIKYWEKKIKSSSNLSV